MMDCSTFQAQFPLSVALQPSPVDRKLLSDHATGCPSCRRMMQEWEETQRALESTLGAHKFEPRHFESISDKLYVERFGTGPDLTPLPPSDVSGLPFGALARFLLGGAGGLLVGYLMWGSSGQGSGLTQLMWLEQMASMGRFGGGPGPIAALPGILGGVGRVVPNLFGICVIIWLCRTRFWELLFRPLPRGIYMARMLVIPLVMVGIVNILGEVFLMPLAMAAGGMAPGLSVGMPLWGIFLLLQAIWSSGFWLLLFLLLFTTIENLVVQTGPLKSSRQDRG